MYRLLIRVFVAFAAAYTAGRVATEKFKEKRSD